VTISRRSLLAAGPFLTLAAGAAASAPDAARGTGDLGVVVERASGSVLIVDTTERSVLQKVEGLGDLSHATAVFSPGQNFAYLFGRDGGLTKLDVLDGRIVKRVVQGGNSIGGAISDDGQLIAVSNYEPGGVRIFDHATLEPFADIPATYDDGRTSKTVGLVDLPGRRFMVSLYDAGEIWLIDCSGAGAPTVTNLGAAGSMPYDGYVTSDGRHYLAGLFGEDGIAHVDLWQEPMRIERVLDGYGKGEEKLPVYKMPHLEGWGDTGRALILPSVGHHEILAIDNEDFTEKARLAVHGQPVFCVTQPGGRYVWVNFAPPENDTVQVVDVTNLKVVHEMTPGPGVLHMEFTPKGREVWISVRDADRIDIYDTATRTKLAELPARKPSGIFFTVRAIRIGL
jgi:protein NirF